MRAHVRNCPKQSDTYAFLSLVLSNGCLVVQPATATVWVPSPLCVTNQDAAAADRASRVSGANAPTARPVSVPSSRR